MAARAESIVDLKRSGARGDRRLQAVRGGRATEPAPPRRRHWRRWLVTALVVALLAGAMSWALKYYAASFTVQHVEIQGEFHNEQAHQIKEALLPYVRGDFFTVDLAGARRSVTALPWVWRASLRREWPNRIHVRIEEQVPVARWNNAGFLNASGEVFAQAYGTRPDALPVLIGPAGRAADVQHRFSKLRDQVAPHGLTIRRLSLDERDTWTLELRQGPVLRLGSHSLQDRLRRFLDVTAFGKGPDLDDVQAVDLRYSNGFAVEWKAGDNGPARTSDAEEAQQDV